MRGLTGVSSSDETELDELSDTSSKTEMALLTVAFRPIETRRDTSASETEGNALERDGENEVFRPEGIMDARCGKPASP